MGVWFCYECQEEMDSRLERCPYCGAVQNPCSEQEMRNGLRMLRAASMVEKPQKPKKRKKRARFSEADCYFMGIHPNDKTWKDLMQLDLLTDDSAWER